MAALRPRLVPSTSLTAAAAQHAFVPLCVNSPCARARVRQFRRCLHGPSPSRYERRRISARTLADSPSSIRCPNYSNPEDSVAQTQSNQVDVLNSFLRGEISAVETYRQAIEKVNKPQLQSQLQACLQSHTQRVQALSEQIRTLGG